MMMTRLSPPQGDPKIPRSLPSRVDRDQGFPIMTPTKFTALHTACVNAQKQLNLESCKTLDLAILVNHSPLNAARQTAFSLQCEVETNAQVHFVHQRRLLLETLAV